MSDEPGTNPTQPPQPPPAGEEQLSPEQEQMLRQMEEEMARVRVQDLVAQSVVSILNLSARRILKEDERDLAQARVGIDAVAALADFLEPDAQREIKNALAQIQMLYAQHVGETGAGDAPPSASGGGPGTEIGARSGRGGRDPQAPARPLDPRLLTGERPSLSSQAARGGIETPPSGPSGYTGARFSSRSRASQTRPGRLPYESTQAPTEEYEP